MRKPKGSYVRNSPDWFIHRMMGAAVAVGSKAANYAYIALFNNDTVGRYIYLTALNFQTSTANGFCYFGLIQGNTAGGTTQAVPLDPLVPVDAGVVVGNFSTTQFVGGKLSSSFASAILGGSSTGSYDWPYEWPIAAVPPGWCAILETAVTGQSLNGTFWWFLATK